MSEAHVTIRGISKRFGRVHALRDVSLDIPRGSFTSFLGPSGCGKTTLLRLIAGFQDPDAGEISIGGTVVNGVPSHLRGAVMVFQDYALFPHLSAAENIVYGLRVRRTPEAVIQEKLSRISSFLSVDAMLSRSPAQLSGGQQQRVALARALITEPQVLLLDEPLSNLDAKLRSTIRAELRQMQRSLGITTIYVTHDQTEALSMSDQLVVMDRGQVAQSGPPRELYDTPRSPAVASFVGSANLLNARVVDVLPDGIQCDVSGVPVRASGASARGRRLGENVVLSLRPEHISVAASETESPQLRDVVVPGILLTSLFEGAGVRYWVKALGQELVADVRGGSDACAEPGVVWIRFEARHVHVMSADEQPEGGPR